MLGGQNLSNRQTVFFSACESCGWQEHKDPKTTSSWLERNKTLIRCEKHSTKKLIWENQFLSWIICILGLHSKTMWNKQRYCGQLQSHVWITNFRGESGEIYIPSKSSCFFVVLWHGGSCKEVCGTILWVGKQDDSTTQQSIHSMHRSMTITSKKKKWNLLENCHKYALKLFWNVHAGHELDDFDVLWSVNTNAWIDWCRTSITHVHINRIVMCKTMQAWDWFKTPILRGILRTQNPLALGVGKGWEHCQDVMHWSDQRSVSSGGVPPNEGCIGSARTSCFSSMALAVRLLSAWTTCAPAAVRGEVSGRVRALAVWQRLQSRVQNSCSASHMTWRMVPQSAFTSCVGWWTWEPEENRLLTSCVFNSVPVRRELRRFRSRWSQRSLKQASVDGVEECSSSAAVRMALTNSPQGRWRAEGSAGS